MTLLGSSRTSPKCRISRSDQKTRCSIKIRLLDHAGGGLLDLPEKEEKEGDKEKREEREKRQKRETRERTKRTHVSLK